MKLVQHSATIFTRRNIICRLLMKLVQHSATIFTRRNIICKLLMKLDFVKLTSSSRWLKIMGDFILTFVCLDQGFCYGGRRVFFAPLEIYMCPPPLLIWNPDFKTVRIKVIETYCVQYTGIVWLVFNISIWNLNI